MASNLLNKINYLNKDIKFMISNYIREYDISKANISILFNKKFLSEEEYYYYLNLPKQDREVLIGKMMLQKPEISEIIQEGIKEFKNKFIQVNEFEDSDILSIKNDAIFIINKVPKITVFENVEFKLKNIYTSYYKINNLELYYGFNQMTQEEVLDVKGIKDSILSLHMNYFADLLKTLFYEAQTSTIEETISLLSNMYQLYLSRELSVEYYREFNDRSLYSLIVMGKNFKASFLPEDQKSYVNISHNLNILRELSSIYTSILQTKRR